jgi:hypothetical protein
MSAPYVAQAASLSAKGHWEQNRVVPERVDAGDRGVAVKPGKDFFNFYNQDSMRVAGMARLMNRKRA